MKEKTVLKNRTRTFFIACAAIVLFSLSFIFISSSFNFRTTRKEVILNYNSEPIDLEKKVHIIKNVGEINCNDKKSLNYLFIL